MAGLTPVHVNRSLQSLKFDGVVELHSRQIRILDWDRMVDIGDFDSDYLGVATPANDTVRRREVA